MMRFKLMGSQHIGPDYEKEPVKVKDESTGKITERYPSKTYNVGEVVLSPTDLEKRFGSEKFRRLKDKGKVESKQVEEEFEDMDEEDENGDEGVSGADSKNVQSKEVVREKGKPATKK